MTGTEATQLVKTLRLQFSMTTLTRVILLCGIGLGFVMIWFGPTPRQALVLWSVVTTAGLAWILLTLLSVRQIKTARMASPYIASGRLDLAERQLCEAVRQFSLYRNGKILAAHNLAVVLHSQKQYNAAAELCVGILSLGRGLAANVRRICRILLADSQLYLGETALAIRAIEPLSVGIRDLNLTEQLLLLPIELRCRVAAQAFDRIVEDLEWKVRRAELLDSPKAALSHALLAKACRHVGDLRRASFLQRRAALYHDLAELEQEYGSLTDSDPDPPGADNMCVPAP